jgi:hypothetical protein
MVKYNTLASFRNGLYGCFGNGRDALMDTCDGLLCATNARTFPELSQSPYFHRRWSSLYEGFDDGQVDRSALQRLFVGAMPPLAAGQRRVVAGDASSIARPESPTARDRAYVHIANTPTGAKPVSPGWQFSVVAALPQKPGSWTTILDTRRIKSDETPAQVLAQQMRELALPLRDDTIFVCDASYGSAVFVKASYPVPLGKLLRVKSNRTFHRDVPEPDPTVKRPQGHPLWHGPVFALNKPETHGSADQEWSGVDGDGHAVEVHVWHGLHFKSCHQATLSVIRVTRTQGPDTKRKPRVIWLIWQGPNRPPPDQFPDTYRLRYSVEHTIRFDKQQLHWAQPRLRTPEKMEIWSDIVAAAHDQITIARQYQKDIRQPWAKHKTEATPQQVHAGMPRIIAALGTPARTAQPRGKSPGRALGAIVTKAERFKIVFKASSNAANTTE